MKTTITKEERVLKTIESENSKKAARIRQRLATITNPRERRIFIDKLAKAQTHRESREIKNHLNLTQKTLLKTQSQLVDATEKATRDHLTGSFNRRTFEEMASKSWSAHKRTGDPLFVMMFDLDHFKNVNDTHGHAAGDHVLKKTAGIIEKTLRQADVFARWGGEEFIAYGSAKPAEGSKENIAALADRVRKTIAKEEIIFDGKKIPVTTSIGVAVVDPSRTSLLEAQKKADEALYRAKHNGRNRVVLQELETKTLPAPHKPHRRSQTAPSKKELVPQ